jgi:DNA-binding MarR family transcriptional regulator
MLPPGILTAASELCANALQWRFLAQSPKSGQDHGLWAGAHGIVKIAPLLKEAARPQAKALMFVNLSTWRMTLPARSARFHCIRNSIKVDSPMASQPLQDMYRRPGFLLKRCHQVSMAIFLDECREFNITQSQYGCLRALHEFPGIDQIAVGRLVGLDRSTVGMVVKMLSDRGLVERVVNRKDKRRMLLKLSAAGETQIADIAPAVARAQERALRALPRGSRAVFLDILERFLAGNNALIDVNDVLAAGPTKDFKEPARQLSSSARPAAGRDARQRKSAI